MRSPVVGSKAIMARDCCCGIVAGLFTPHHVLRAPPLMLKGFTAAVYGAGGM